MSSERPHDKTIAPPAGGRARRHPDDDEQLRLVWIDTSRSRSERLVVHLVRRLRRLVPTMMIIFADFAGLVVAGQSAVWLRHLVAPVEFGSGFYPILFVYAGLMQLSYLAVGLYSGVALSGPDELRRLTLSSLTLTLIMAIVTYASRDHLDAGVFMYFIACGIAIVSVPLARSLIRAAFAKRNWWGRKAVVLCHDPQAAWRVVRALARQPRLGLKPAAILSTSPEAPGTGMTSVPQLHGAASALSDASRRDIDYAIVAVTDLSRPEDLSLIRRYESYFRHWLLVPSRPNDYSLWVRTRDLDGLLGLDLTHCLMRTWDRVIKRIMDVLLTLLGAVFVLPVGLLIALAIKLDSPGPALFSQVRLGRGGRPFSALKFRSMVADADAILDRYLASHPQLKDEWEATHKLKDDPRITAVGKFLRRTSLDELPQLINVLRGEMSLVGPRPIVQEEVCRYDSVWELYKRVRPGITGQWQISGRSETTYKERTAMDAYYVRNWSVWLDLYILAATVLVVLRGDGAY